MENSENPSLGRILNQKQYCISEEITEINATIKHLREAKIVLPIEIPFNFPVFPSIIPRCILGGNS